MSFLTDNLHIKILTQLPDVEGMRKLPLTAILFLTLLMVTLFQNCGRYSQFETPSGESSFNSKVLLDTFVHEGSTSLFDEESKEFQDQAFEFLFLSDQDSGDITEFGILKAKDTGATVPYWSVKGGGGELKLSKDNPLKDMKKQVGEQSWYLPYWYRSTQGPNGFQVWLLSYFSEREQGYLDFESSDIRDIKKDQLEILILNEFLKSLYFENAEKTSIDWNFLSAKCLDSDCKTILFNLSKVE